MATVAEVTAKYENFLVPVLGSRDGVCDTCKRSILYGWPRCYQCNGQRRALPYLADAVAPVSLAVKTGQWAHELSSYKNSPRIEVRRTLSVGIGAVLWRWLDGHERCVAEDAGAEEFEVVTSVPSTRGRPQHPLPEILTSIVQPTSARYTDLLQPNPGYSPGSREPGTDRYSVGRQLHGESILLVDDQWTSGGHAQSAACALKLAGAGPVAVVALGRHFDRQMDRQDYRAAAEEYYRAARAQGWSWSTCCLCAPASPRHRSRPDIMSDGTPEA